MVPTNNFYSSFCGMLPLSARKKNWLEHSGHNLEPINNDKVIVNSLQDWPFTNPARPAE